MESGSQGVGQSGYQGVGVWGSQLGTRSQGLRVLGSRGVGFSELESWSRGLREWGCRGVGISELGSQGDSTVLKMAHDGLWIWCLGGAG